MAAVLPAQPVHGSAAPEWEGMGLSTPGISGQGQSGFWSVTEEKYNLVLLMVLLMGMLLMVDLKSRHLDRLA